MKLYRESSVGNVRPTWKLKIVKAGIGFVRKCTFLDRPMYRPNGTERVKGIPLGNFELLFDICRLTVFDFCRTQTFVDRLVSKCRTSVISAGSVPKWKLLFGLVHASLGQWACLWVHFFKPSYWQSHTLFPI